ncbi:MAG: hypothetical protein IPK58_19190 [Acidobacteria bacterium]|nr:hypothetical protein [Acidobacteriota bacterium]
MQVRGFWPSKTRDANPAPPADLAVWRPLSGVWWVLGANQQTTSQQWGLPADKPVPGDYDGDGKTDFAIWRSGDWWIMRSSDSSSYMISLGASGDARRRPISTATADRPCGLSRGRRERRLEDPAEHDESGLRAAIRTV